MFSSFKKLFRTETVRPTVTIKSGEVFPWHRGVRLEASEDSELIFPGEILRDEELIGSIIEVDDDAEIGFQPRPDKSFELIILRLKAGHAVTLHRGSDVLLGGSDVAEKVFYVLPAASQITGANRRSRFSFRCRCWQCPILKSPPEFAL